ncbi:MAG TPA: dTMP kinase [Gemmatimonadaceae bacterium]|nr:dTMP kinase [Gemmatimonadaceae bacterium]
MERGKLVVFEGTEGSGKSTQLRLLSDRLSAAGVPVVPLREPGGTPVGDTIREILLKPTGDVTPAAEALLFMGSRAELVSREIKPALKRGDVVLMDRFFLSTYAYQIAGRGLPEADVRGANCLATCGIVPDLTIVLDFPSADGIDRAAMRGIHDRIESSGEDFHQRVERAFAEAGTAEWQAKHPECGPIVKVDGRGAREEVFARVLTALLQAMPNRFAALREETIS